MGAWVIIFLVLSIVCATSMGIAWWLKLRSLPLLVMAAALGAGAVGAFLAQAGTAMASAVHPRDALIRGAAMGIVLGLLWGGICAGLLKASGKLT